MATAYDGKGKTAANQDAIDERLVIDVPVNAVIEFLVNK